MLYYYLQSILIHMKYIMTKLGKVASAQCKLITDIICLEGKEEEEEQKRICRQLNMNTFVKYVGTCLMGTIVSLLQVWGNNRPVGTRCKLLEKEDMTGWDANRMQIIKCCADVGLMHNPEDQVHVIFEWNDEAKSPSTKKLLSYMKNH